MLKPEKNNTIPQQTIQVAKAAFPKGNIYMRLRDELGPIYTDEELAELYPEKGQPGHNPWRLALVTVMPYVENLTDRQAADAVRGRIDGGKEAVLLEKMLSQLASSDLLNGKQTQRTDATHVIAKIRSMNRLEMVGETVRRVLNDLAIVAPEWLREHVQPQWVERYGRRFDAHRLPKSKEERQALAKEIGQNGYLIMTAAYEENIPAEVQDLTSLEILRCIWVQQYYLVEDEICWRTKEKWGHPPARQMIASPDELDARYSGKRGMYWSGYKVHLTETCEPGHPHLITHVKKPRQPQTMLMLQKRSRTIWLKKTVFPSGIWSTVVTLTWKYYFTVRTAGLT